MRQNRVFVDRYDCVAKRYGRIAMKTGCSVVRLLTPKIIEFLSEEASGEVITQSSPHELS